MPDLSPPPPPRRRAKYELQHLVRTHLGANKSAFECIFQCSDEQGIVGVRLSKELMAVAGEALKANITTLGPLVLPISEQLLFFFNLVLRKVGRWVWGWVWGWVALCALCGLAASATCGHTLFQHNPLSAQTNTTKDHLVHAHSKRQVKERSA
jgi:hypothetical protein